MLMPLILLRGTQVASRQAAVASAEASRMGRTGTAASRSSSVTAASTSTVQRYPAMLPAADAMMP